MIKNPLQHCECEMKKNGDENRNPDGIFYGFPKMKQSKNCWHKILKRERRAKKRGSKNIVYWFKYQLRLWDFVKASTGIESEKNNKSELLFQISNGWNLIVRSVNQIVNAKWNQINYYWFWPRVFLFVRHLNAPHSEKWVPQGKPPKKHCRTHNATQYHSRTKSLST